MSYGVLSPAVAAMVAGPGSADPGGFASRIGRDNHGSDPGGVRGRTHRPLRLRDTPAFGSLEPSEWL